MHKSQYIFRYKRKPNECNLDDGIKSGVNILTNRKCFILGEDNVPGAWKKAGEDRCPHRRGHIQLQRRQGARSEVQRQRVLRSTRCRAGSIRDAAAGLGRQGFGDRGLSRVRCLKADLLPSQGELRRGRSCGLGAGKAWAPWPTQDRPRRHGLPGGASGLWRTGASTRAGKTAPPGSRDRSPSQNDRAGIKKNSTLNRSVTPVRSAPDIVADYETLRAAALGEALPIMARSGLILFLRRGMWGWAQALTTAARPAAECVGPPPATPSRPGRHGAITHVLASIAMSIQPGRLL